MFPVNVTKYTQFVILQIHEYFSVFITRPVASFTINSDFTDDALYTLFVFLCHSSGLRFRFPSPLRSASWSLMMINVGCVLIGILTGPLRWITMQVCVRMCKCVRASSRAVKSIDLFVWSIRKLICGRGWKTTPKLNLGSDFFSVCWIFYKCATNNRKLCFVLENISLFTRLFCLFVCVQEMVRRGEILDDSMEDEFYLRRLDAGLFVLQLICYIMVEISNSGIPQVHTHAHACTHARTQTGPGLPISFQINCS